MYVWHLTKSKFTNRDRLRSKGAWCVWKQINRRLFKLYSGEFNQGTILKKNISENCVVEPQTVKPQFWFITHVNVFRCENFREIYLWAEVTIPKFWVFQYTSLFREDPIPQSNFDIDGSLPSHCTWGMNEISTLRVHKASSCLARQFRSVIGKSCV